MSSFDFKFDDAAFHEFIDTNKGVKKALEDQGDRAVELTKQRIDVPFPGRPNRNPPGDGRPPMKRSGKLLESVQRTEALDTIDGITVYVGAPGTADPEYKFSTNDKNDNAFPDEPYIMLLPEHLVE